MPSLYPLGGYRVLGGAEREAGVVVEDQVFSYETQSATEFSCSAGVRDQLEAAETRGEFGFDDLDGGDPGMGLVDIGARDAVFAGAAAGAAAKNFILHITPSGLVAASADDNRAAAAAVRDLFVWNQLAEGLKERFH